METIETLQPKNMLTEETRRVLNHVFFIQLEVQGLSQRHGNRYVPVKHYIIVHNGGLGHC